MLSNGMGKRKNLVARAAFTMMNVLLRKLRELDLFGGGQDRIQLLCSQNGAEVITPYIDTAHIWHCVHTTPSPHLLPPLQ